MSNPYLFICSLFRQICTPKSEAVSTAREEILQKKIRTLEEQVSEYQVAIQRGKELHKSKVSNPHCKNKEINAAVVN